MEGEHESIITARATVAAIASGATSARAECEAAIARIEALDGAINAVVVRDFDRARAAADTADACVAAGARRPLLGLPTTWGFAEHADHIPNRDAVVVERLKRAGAVILGKTNVPVALGDGQSVNPVHGRTHNPRARGRSAGGSSGGSAAALASGMVSLEYGSDIGGSVRVPAHFCGVWGHKPTHGVVPLTGHWMPRTDGARGVLGVAGPLATDADDLELALNSTADHPLADATCPTLAGMRMLVLDRHPVAPIGGDVAGVLDAAVQAAKRAGPMIITDALLPDLMAMHGDYIRLLLTTLSRGGGTNGTASLANWFDMLDTQARYRRRWTALFERVDVVLAPVAGIASFAHDDLGMAGRTADIDGVRQPFAPQLGFAGLANYPDLPATAFPAGTAPSGPPVGLRVIAAPFADRTAIAAAPALAAALSWRTAS